MLGCLNHMGHQGFEGMVLGTLVIPFCIGIGAVLTPPFPSRCFSPWGMGPTAALGLLHLGVVTIQGKAHRVVGALLVVVYAVFVYKSFFTG